VTANQLDRPALGLPRGLALLLAAASVVIILAGMRTAAWLLGPVLLAMVLVIAAYPFARWLRSKGVPGWLATTALIVFVYAFIALVVGVVVVSVARLASLLPEYSDRADALVQQVMNGLARFGVDRDEIQRAASGLDFDQISGAVQSVLGAATSLVGNIVFLLSLLLFLSFESATVGARRAQFAVGRQDMNDSLERFMRNTNRYLVVTTVFGLIVAALDVIALWILGVPLALLWGVLAFLTNYIPNVGFIVGLVPPALLALLEGGWGLMIAVIAIYIVIDVVLQSFIQPRFIGDAVGLSSTVAFLSLILWAWVLGPVGAILAVPLTLLVKAILVDTDPRADWVQALIGSVPSDGHREKGRDKGQRRFTLRIRKRTQARHASDKATAR
jgi:predicted PurR-regulated permease PerM